MQHSENIRKVLKAARLSENSELTPEQLVRAKAAAEREAKLAAREIKGRPLNGSPLAKFIMKGAGNDDAGGAAARPAPGSSRVKGKMSMTAAAEKILGRAKGPLHASEIYKRAEKQGLVTTEGKTPEQTMAARLATGARDGKFKRTAPNTFTLPKKKAPKAKGRKKVSTAA